MKPGVFLVLLTGWFFARAASCAAGDPQPTITVQATVVSLPKDQALRFLARHHLESDAAGGFTDLLARVEKGTATSVANPSVTARSGQHASNNAGAVILEVEPVASPSAELVDTTLLFTCGAIKIGTSFTSKSGAVKFLGSYDAPDAASEVTYLVFLRASVSRGD